MAEQKNPSIRYIRPPGLNSVELLFMPDSDFGLVPHIHDAWVVWLTAGGGEKFCFKGTECILQPDSYGVVAPGEVHANAPVRGRRTLLSIYAPPSALEEAMRHAVGADPDSPCTADLREHVHRDPEARCMLARLHARLASSPSPLANRTAFLETFSALFVRHGYAPRKQPADSRDLSRVRRACEMLRAYSRTPVTLTDLALSLNCSTRHFIRMFKAEMNTTPHAYLMQLRLERARTLLAGGESPLNAALEAGFADQSHLTRAFKRRFGITPSVYRSQALA